MSPRVAKFWCPTCWQVAEGPSNTEHQDSDFGRRTLKGFEDEEQIYEVLWQATA